jgi:hypothetical protein
MKNLTNIACALLMMTMLGGCVWGNSPKVLKPTIGQQLIDLKRALDDGAMSETEYDRS